MPLNQYEGGGGGGGNVNISGQVGADPLNVDVTQPVELDASQFPIPVDIAQQSIGLLNVNIAGQAGQDPINVALAPGASQDVITRKIPTAYQFSKANMTNAVGQQYYIEIPLQGATAETGDNMYNFEIQMVIDNNGIANRNIMTQLYNIVGDGRYVPASQQTSNNLQSGEVIVNHKYVNSFQVSTANLQTGSIPPVNNAANYWQIAGGAGIDQNIIHAGFNGVAQLVVWFDNDPLDNDFLIYAIVQEFERV